jgi:hypothetical protein
MSPETKKAVIPVRVTALACPVLMPSSEPWYSGKDADIDNEYASYDDGQRFILKIKIVRQQTF